MGVVTAPVALQMWSLNKPCQEDFAGCLKKVREMGYDGVEFAGFHDMAAADLKKLVADLGLGIAGSHTGKHLLEGDEFDKTVEYNLALGNKNIVVPAVGEDIRKSAQTWKDFAGWLSETAGKLEEKGLRLGYHNHAFEFDAVDGEIPFHIVFENTPENVMMQVDMGWSFRAGTDARDLFNKYPGRSFTTHVKAFDPDCETARVGEDTVPWAEVIPVAIETGKCEWFIVEHERHGENDPFDSVKICLDYLKNL